jgi:hypothetical protein
MGRKRAKQAGRVGRGIGSRLILVLAALVLSCFAAAAQTGFDRPGQDYASFAVRSGDPAVCAQRCDRDRRCRAWSFAYPTTVAPRAMCYLKRGVPARVENPCCVSGVRGSGVVVPRSGKVEFGIDRFGGDYRSLEVPAHPEGATCAAACQGEARCRAWTYVRPGYQGGAARCYLKSRVTRPRKRPCCISGVLR